MLDTNGYKIFLKNNLINLDPSRYINSDFIHSSYLFACYDYKIPNDYENLLNTASSLGLKQFVLSPSSFFKLVAKLVELKFRIKRIEFEPPIGLEMQEEIDVIITNLNIQETFLSVESQLQKLKFKISEIDDEFDSIPKQVHFSKQGNQFFILNNGVVIVDDESQLHEIEPLLSSFICEVKQ